LILQAHKTEAAKIAQEIHTKRQEATAQEMHTGFANKGKQVGALQVRPGYKKIWL